MYQKICKQTAFLWKAPKSNSIIKKINQLDERELNLLTGKLAYTLYEEQLVDSELLFGDKVWVFEELAGFKRVAAVLQGKEGDELGYEGYIQATDAKVCSTNVPNDSQVAIVTQFAELEFPDSRTKAFYPFGCTFPVLLEKDTLYEVLTPLGRALVKKTQVQQLTEFTARACAKNMVNLAKQFIGLSYVWGGIGGTGFDCSGFIYSLHRIHGLLLPRDAHEQAQVGKTVAYADALPGDVLFFAYEQGKGFIHHVGLYLGEDYMIHSHTPGSKVLISRISGTNYELELCVVKRYYHE